MAVEGVIVLRLSISSSYLPSNRAMSGEPQRPANGTLSAELGSLSLEFTRLSILTGDAKFFDAMQRITDRFEQAQSKSKLPGMWPMVVNPQEPDFGGDYWFTLGAMADSLYEYLPKVSIPLVCELAHSNKDSNICYLAGYLSSIETCTRWLLTHRRKTYSSDQ